MRLIFVASALLLASAVVLGEDPSGEPTLYDRPVSHWLDELERQSNSPPGELEEGYIPEAVLLEIGPDDTAAAELVAARLAKTTDAVVQIALLNALAGVGTVPNSTIPTLDRLAKQEDPHIRIPAAYLLWRTTGDKSRGWPTLLEAIRGNRPSHLAMDLLGRSGRRASAAAPYLAKHLESTSSRDRKAAAWALARLEATDSLSLVRKAMAAETDSADKAVLACAIWSLQKDGHDVIEVVRNGLRVADYAGRSLVALAIADLGLMGSSLVPDLEAALAREEWAGNRAILLTALGSMGHAAQQAVPAILKAMRGDPYDPTLQCAGLRALGRIGVRSEEVLKTIRVLQEIYGEDYYYARETLRKLGVK